MMILFRTHAITVVGSALPVSLSWMLSQWDSWRSSRAWLDLGPSWSSPARHFGRREVVQTSGELNLP